MRVVIFSELPEYQQLDLYEPYRIICEDEIGFVIFNVQEFVYFLKDEEEKTSKFKLYDLKEN